MIIIYENDKIVTFSIRTGTSKIFSIMIVSRKADMI